MSTRDSIFYCKTEVSEKIVNKRLNEKN